METSSPGKSLITEIERLREAVLLLCDLQRDLTVKLEAALHPIPNNGGGV